MKRMLMMTVAGVFTAAMVHAQDATQSLIDQFRAQGYTHIEVKRGLGQIKIEGYRAGVSREIVVDLATGAIVKDESESAREPIGSPDDIEIKDENRDFLDDDHDDDHDDDDHGRRGHHDDDDDHDDDHDDDDDDDDHGDDHDDDDGDDDDDEEDDD